MPSSLVRGQARLTGFEVRPVAERAEMTPGQVHQLAPDLEHRKMVEMGRRFDFDPFQRPAEAYQRILEYIVGLLQAAQGGVAPEHPAGESAQPLAGVFDQPTKGVGVAVTQAINPAGGIVVRGRGDLGGHRDPRNGERDRQV
jgi:hypothetical protein